MESTPPTIAPTRLFSRSWIPESSAVAVRWLACANYISTELVQVMVHTVLAVTEISLVYGATLDGAIEVGENVV